MKHWRKLFILSFLFLTSCGYIENSCDKSNYESLSNETGTIELYSGGVLIASYKNANIIYSNSDSDAIWFETETDSTIYWQGDMRIKIK